MLHVPYFKLLRWGCIFTNCYIAIVQLEELKTILSSYTTHPGVPELSKNLDDQEVIAELTSVAIQGKIFKKYWPGLTKVQDGYFYLR